MVELTTENGKTRDLEQIKSMVQDFYKTLYERGDSNTPVDRNNFCENMGKVSQENKLNILAPLTLSDVEIQNKKLWGRRKGYTIFIDLE